MGQQFDIIAAKQQTSKMTVGLHVPTFLMVQKEHEIQQAQLKGYLICYWIGWGASSWPK